MAHSNLICFGHNPWSRMWKRNQTMVKVLSEQSFIDQVLFVNPSVHCTHLLTSPRSEFGAFRRNIWHYGVPRRVARNVTVGTPVMPPLYSRLPWATKLVQSQLRSIVKSIQSRPYVLLLNRFADPEDEFFGDIYRNATIRYLDWSDDFEVFCTSDESRRRSARIREKYLQDCDLVTAVNPALTRRAEAHNENALTIRNATNYDIMQRADAEETPLPRNLPPGSPVIGYIGYLNYERLDANLIDHVSRERPEWQLVFVGPHSVPNPLGLELPQRDNVHLLPAVPYDHLPRYLKAFDVCMIPNLINTHTEGNDPIKLFDYLASGNPIVSTATAGTSEFAHVIEIAQGPAEFVSCIETALSSADDPDAKRNRLATARENSWDVRFQPVVDELSRLVQR